MNLSGIVAILDENGSVVETRDLGPVPVGCKPGFVLPLEDDKPELGKDQAHGDPTFDVLEDKVIRHWPVIDLGPVNFPLSPLQLRLGIINAGTPLSVVEGTLAAITDQAQRETAQTWWQFANPIYWDHPVRQQLTALVGLSEEQAAAMWMKAKDI